MRSSRTFPAAVAALAAGISLRAVAAELVRNPDTLVFASVGDVTSLDPAVPYDAVSPGIIFNVYDTLLVFAGETNDRLAPSIATTVPSVKNGLVSMDGRNYTFIIRKGAAFHDGSPLTPQDVRYSLMRFMLTDPAGGPASLLLEPILGVTSTRDASGKIQIHFEDVERAVRVEGDRVIVHLKEPFAPFLSIMARWSYVMSRSWAKAHGEWDGEAATWRRFNNPEKESSYFYERMNGTGPFMLERWDRQGRRVYLKRNDRYWGKPAALKRVVIAAVPEFQTQKLMLEAGDADIIESPRPFLSQLKNLPGVRVADGLPRLTTDPILFFTFHIDPAGNPNIGSGRLDGAGIPPDFFIDENIRKGFAYAFDYDAFINDVGKGADRRASGPIPPGLLGHNPRGPRYTMDLIKASSHFKKAWGGKAWEKGFKFTIAFNTGGEMRHVACQILKKNVESLNPKFRVDLRNIEWSVFLEQALNHKLPLFARPWMADYPDPHNFMFPLYHSEGRFPSIQGFHDPEMDKLIAQALRETDPRRREQIYFKLQQRGYEEVPHLLTVYRTGVYTMRTWVRGFYDNAAFLGIYFYPIYKKGAGL